MVEERIWKTPRSNYQRLLPNAIEVKSRGYSKRLARVLTDFGSEHSFALAAQQVQEHYGFQISASAVRQATLEHAQRARQMLHEKYQESFRMLPAQGAEHVVAQVDGTMICTVAPGKRKGKRPRDWKEARLSAAQALGSVQVVYGAGFSDVAQTGRRWGHCAREAGWGLNTRIHAVGDGAEWIRAQTLEVFGKQGSFLCDFYHVSEYLGGAAPSCRSENPDQWRRTQQARLKRGAADKVMKELIEHMEPTSIPEEQAPVRRCHRYLENRKDSLDYASALKLGLPIGSGMIESGHRHVLQARLKKAGTAWLENNADAIAHLRVVRANGNWQSFWN